MLLRSWSNGVSKAVYWWANGRAQPKRRVQLSAVRNPAGGGEGGGILLLIQ